MRETILFNDDWLFHRGDVIRELPKAKGPLYKSSKTERAIWGAAAYAYNDHPDNYGIGIEIVSEKWETVQLPHDYIILQAPDGNENNTLGYFKYENAWYRKHFALTEADKSKHITLLFEGIATNATVYLNGCLLKHNFCGYTPFEVDITDYADFDRENILAVYVNTQNHEGWWYEGGGIYRNVWMVKTEKVSVDLYGVYAAPERIDNKTWNVNFETTVRNDFFEGQAVKVATSIIDAEGNTFAVCDADLYVKKRTASVVKYSVNVIEPILWDIDNPYQYGLKTEIYIDNDLVDTYFTKTGFRTYSVDADKGLFLNGRHVKIKGVCAHEDCGLTGKAVADNVNRYKIELLKEMGANGYRTSHYPQNPAIMDALDDLGFIVMAETRWFDSSDEGVEQLKTLIKRDRNRPSVFFWSIGNEEPYFITDKGRRISQSLKAEVLKLDKTRCIISAVSLKPDEATVFDGLDLVSINYNIPLYDMLHKKYPNKPMLSSENCATGTTRGWYYDDCTEKGYISAYDKDTNQWFRGREHTWKFLCEHDYIMGGYQWTGFEHRGETVWPRLCSQSGAVDLFLQKKDAFYQNQSHWLDKPMIHMLPHWNVLARNGESVRVWVYTNCDEAELVLNGESLGKQKVEKYTHVEWNVPYMPGKIEAIGYINGIETVRDINLTAGKPVKLMLKSENKIYKNNDVAIVTCYTVDGEGVFVPDATPYVEFFADSGGVVIATGSDICDHNPVTDSSRKMRAGLITVAVKAVDITKGIKLYAQSYNLDSAVLDITSITI